MKRYMYTIQDPNGMHARPAGALVTFAKQFSSDIRVSANGKEADAKRLLSLMGLGATCGTELSFEVEGVDEDRAVSELARFFEDQANRTKDESI